MSLHLTGQQQNGEQKPCCSTCFFWRRGDVARGITAPGNCLHDLGTVIPLGPQPDGSFGTITIYSTKSYSDVCHHHPDVADWLAAEKHRKNAEAQDQRSEKIVNLLKGT
jgi:hypothetical protein